MEQINELTGEVTNDDVFGFDNQKEIKQEIKTYDEKLSEAIEKANSEVKMTNIKGKAYAQVWQRVKAFRKVYPKGSIKTEIVAQGDNLDFVRMKAYVYDFDGGNMLGMSEHMEKKVNNGKFDINDLDILGNCETSVVGRALGFAGFMGNGEIASVEDMQKVEGASSDTKQATSTKDPKFASKSQKDLIKAKVDEGRLSNILFKIGVASIDDLTVKQASDIIGGKYNG